MTSEPIISPAAARAQVALDELRWGLITATEAQIRVRRETWGVYSDAASMAQGTVNRALQVARDQHQAAFLVADCPLIPGPPAAPSPLDALWAAYRVAYDAAHRAWAAIPAKERVLDGEVSFERLLALHGEWQRAVAGADQALAAYHDVLLAAGCPPAEAG